jgi:predicted nucleic acid-binding protein
LIVCIDTSLLIYALQENPSTAAEGELLRRSKEYMEWLEDKNVPVMLPTPVISEFLTGRDRTVRLDVLTALSDFAVVCDFDLRAAILASELRSEYWLKHKLPKGVKRQIVTVDMMIVATAIVNGAALIVTHNLTDFKNIAGERIEIRSIEEGPPGQGRLFS